MKNKLRNTLLALPVAMLAAETPAAAPADTFIIPRIETASTGYKLDGSLNDKVWQNAAIIPNFTHVRFGEKISDKTISSKTTVKMFYDVDALYLGFTCHEQNIKKIVTGLPAGQTVDVPIGGSDDCLEMMIFLPGSDSVYYHMRLVPSGAKEDARNIYRGPGDFRRDSSWNGDWTVKTKIDEAAKLWTAEVKIPFKMFAEAEAGFFSTTPAKGDKIRINLGRVSSPAAETTTWQDGPRGFHSKFANCTFAGMSFGDIQLIKPENQRIVNGKNQYTVTLCNNAARPVKIRVVAKLTEDENDPVKRAEQRRKRHWIKPFRTTTVLDQTYDLKAGEKKPVTVAFEIKEGGEKQLYFNVDWLRMKHHICHSNLVDNLYDIQSGISKNTEKNASLSKCLKEAAAKGLKTPPAVNAQIKQVTDYLKKAQDNAISPFEKTSALQKAEKVLEKIEFHVSTVINPSLWNIQNNRKTASFAIGTAPAGEKVFRDLPFKGTFSNKISMSLAGNEYESAQLVIFYLKKAKDTIRISCSDLISEKGNIIKADQFKFHRVGFVNVGDSGHHTHVGYWPDVLFPESEIKPPVKGDLQSVMLTLKTEKNQKAGNYTGTVTLDNGKEKQTVTIAVRVYPFSLPDKKSLGMNIWFHGTRVHWFYDQHLLSTKLFDQVMSVQGAYHFATGIRGNMMGKLIRVKETVDGKYKFDFSLVAPYMDISVKHNATVLNLDTFGADFFTKPQKILIGKDGKLQYFRPADPAAAADQLFKETVQFFKEKDYLKYAVIQISDEPWSEKAQQQIRERSAHLRKLVGKEDMPRVITAGTVRNRMNLSGAINIWCPQFPQFNPADYKNMKKEESLFFYQCLYKPEFPMYMIDRPGIEPRITGMICWKFNAKGFLYWTSEQWLGGAANTPENKKKLQNRWIHEEWGFPIRDCPGDGCFIYPTKDGVIPSLRAQYIREGVEDYEYLAILKKTQDQVLKKGKMTVPLRRETEAMLKVPDSIVKATNDWTKSEAELTGFREKVAEQIIKLQNRLK